mmetsp:Transcript_109173/g.319561  ORF Transcript_109173/g.319561 Transcript_109173/m.319561 type:complete len:415 (-) Transcript_109173:154-1398(-)
MAEAFERMRASASPTRHFRLQKESACEATRRARELIYSRGSTELPEAEDVLGEDPDSEDDETVSNASDGSSVLHITHEGENGEGRGAAPPPDHAGGGVAIAGSGSSSDSAGEQLFFAGLDASSCSGSLSEALAEDTERSPAALLDNSIHHGGHSLRQGETAMRSFALWASPTSLCPAEVMDVCTQHANSNRGTLTTANLAFHEAILRGGVEIQHPSMADEVEEPHRTSVLGFGSEEQVPQRSGGISSMPPHPSLSSCRILDREFAAFRRAALSLAKSVGDKEPEGLLTRDNLEQHEALLKAESQTFPMTGPRVCECDNARGLLAFHSHAKTTPAFVAASAVVGADAASLISSFAGDGQASVQTPATFGDSEKPDGELVRGVRPGGRGGLDNDAESASETTISSPCTSVRATSRT